MKEVSSLAGKKVYSILDIKDGFYHIELDAESNIAMFQLFLGYVDFSSPFGLKNLPEKFKNWFISTLDIFQGLNIF